PGCSADNKEGAKTCAACGAELKPSRPGRLGRNRGRSGPNGPLTLLTQANHRAASRAYGIALAAMIPGLGLILGPLAVILGLIARRRALNDPDFHLKGPLCASLIFGAATTACNWIGFGMMFLGLLRLGVL